MEGLEERSGELGLPVHAAANFDNLLLKILPSYVLSGETSRLHATEASMCTPFSYMVERNKNEGISEISKEKYGEKGESHLSKEILDKIHDICLQNSDFVSLQYSSAYHASATCSLPEEPGKTCGDCSDEKDHHEVLSSAAPMHNGQSVGPSRLLDELPQSTITQAFKADSISITPSSQDFKGGFSRKLFESIHNHFRPNINQNSERQKHDNSDEQIPDYIQSLGTDLTDLNAKVHNIYKTAQTPRDHTGHFKQLVLDDKSSLSIYRMFSTDNSSEETDEEKDSASNQAAKAFAESFHAYIQSSTSAETDDRMESTIIESLQLCCIDFLRLAIITTMWKATTWSSSGDEPFTSDSTCPFYDLLTSQKLINFTMNLFGSVLERFSETLYQLSLKDSVITHRADSLVRKFPSTVFNSIVLCFDLAESVIRNVRYIFRCLYSSIGDLFRHTTSAIGTSELPIKAFESWLHDEPSDKYLHILFTILKIPAIQRCSKSKRISFFLPGLVESTLCALSEFLSIQISLSSSSSMPNAITRKAAVSQQSVFMPIKKYLEKVYSEIPGLLSRAPLCEEPFCTYSLKTAIEPDLRGGENLYFKIDSEVRVAMRISDRYISTFVVLLQELLTTIASYLAYQDNIKEFHEYTQSVAGKALWNALTEIISSSCGRIERSGSEAIKRDHYAKGYEASVHQLISEIYFCSFCPQFPFSTILLDFLVHSALCDTMAKGKWLNLDAHVCPLRTLLGESDKVAMSSLSFSCLSGLIRMATNEASTQYICDSSESLNTHSATNFDKEDFLKSVLDGDLSHSESKAEVEIGNDFVAKIRLIQHRLKTLVDDHTQGYLKENFRKLMNAPVQNELYLRSRLCATMGEAGQGKHKLLDFDRFFGWLAVWVYLPLKSSFEQEYFGELGPLERVNSSKLAGDLLLGKILSALYEGVASHDPSLVDYDSAHVHMLHKSTLFRFSESKIPDDSSKAQLVAYSPLSVHAQLRILYQLSIQFSEPSTQSKGRRSIVDAFTYFIARNEVDSYITSYHRASMMRFYEVAWKLLQSGLHSEIADLRVACITAAFALFKKLSKSAQNIALLNNEESTSFQQNQNAVFAFVSVSHALLLYLLRVVTRDSSSVVRSESLRKLLLFLDGMKDFIGTIRECSAYLAPNILESTFGAQIIQMPAQAASCHFEIRALESVITQLPHARGQSESDCAKFSIEIARYLLLPFDRDLSSTKKSFISQEAILSIVRMLSLFSRNMREPFIIPDFLIGPQSVDTQQEFQKMFPILFIVGRFLSADKQSEQAHKIPNKKAASTVQRLLVTCIALIASIDSALTAKFWKVLCSLSTQYDDTTLEYDDTRQSFELIHNIFLATNKEAKVGISVSLSFFTHGLVSLLGNAVDIVVVQLLQEVCVFYASEILAPQHHQETIDIFLNLISSLRVALKRMFKSFERDFSSEQEEASSDDKVSQVLSNGLLLLRPLTQIISRYTGSHANAVISSSIYSLCENLAYRDSLHSMHGKIGGLMVSERTHYIKTLVPLFFFSYEKVCQFIDDSSDSSRTPSALTPILRHMLILSELVVTSPFASIAKIEISALLAENQEAIFSSEFPLTCFEIINTLFKQLVHQYAMLSGSSRSDTSSDILEKSVCMIFDRMASMASHEPQKLSSCIVDVISQSLKLQYVLCRPRVDVYCVYGNACGRCMLTGGEDSCKIQCFLQMRSLQYISDTLQTERAYMEESCRAHSKSREKNWDQQEKHGIVAQQLTERFLDTAQDLAVYSHRQSTREAAIDVLMAILEQSITSPEKFISTLASCYDSQRAKYAWTQWVESRLSRGRPMSAVNRHQDVLQLILTQAPKIFQQMYQYTVSKAIESGIDVFKEKKWSSLNVLQQIGAFSSDWKAFRQPLLSMIIRFLGDHASRRTEQHVAKYRDCSAETCFWLKLAHPQAKTVLSLPQYARFSFFVSLSVFNLLAQDEFPKGREVSFVMNECDKFTWTVDFQDAAERITDASTKSRPKSGRTSIGPNLNPLLEYFDELFSYLATVTLQVALTVLSGSQSADIEDLCKRISVSPGQPGPRARALLVFDWLMAKIISTADECTLLKMRGESLGSLMRELSSLHGVLTSSLASPSRDSGSPHVAPRKAVSSTRKASRHKRYVDSSSSSDYEYP